MKMKKLLIILTILLLTLCSSIFAETPHIGNQQTEEIEARLQLDTGGHTDIIWDIITTDNGEIISASSDKTIRVWDVKTGKEKRKILGKIGAGMEGKIFAIALSPDKRYLAVGGFFGNSSKSWGNIRIYNYQTGKLQRVLKSHTDVIHDLSFSPDGAYLISASGDKTTKIWSVRDDFTLYDTIVVHKKEIYAVKIIKTKGKYFAITAGFDNQIALYDMQSKKIINHHKLNYRLDSLAISISLGHIAVCGNDREIVIYDFSLNFIKKIRTKTIPTGLNYSKDSEYLIAGTATSPRNINIYKTNKYTLFSTFKKHADLTKAVEFIEIEGKTYAVSGGGNNKEIYIWDIATKRVKTKIEGAGEAVWSIGIGINGDSVAWGSKFNYIGINNRGEFQKEINLQNFQIKNINLKSRFYRIFIFNKKLGEYLLHSKEGSYGYSEGGLNIIKNDRVIHKIIKNATDGYRHNCYGWYKDFIVSGGMNGHLNIYNRNGKKIASLVGHTGEVWSLAVDRDKLVSGSDDQTIRVWDLSKLKMINDKLKINEINLAMTMKINNLTREEVLKIAQTNNRVYNAIYIFPKLYPQLNLFISKNNDWVAWTPNGFFDASKNGAKYIGYHINHGADHEAEFLPISYFKKLHRPDLIAKAINGEDISQYAKELDIGSLLNKK